MTIWVFSVGRTAEMGPVIAAKDLNIVNDVEIYWTVMPGVSSGLGHHKYVTFLGQ